jgi:hypothetical protein
MLPCCESTLFCVLGHDAAKGDRVRRPALTAVLAEIIRGLLATSQLKCVKPGTGGVVPPSVSVASAALIVTNICE